MAHGHPQSFHLRIWQENIKFDRNVKIDKKKLFQSYLKNIAAKKLFQSSSSFARKSCVFGQTLNNIGSYELYKSYEFWFFSKRALWIITLVEIAFFMTRLWYILDA